MAFLFLFRSRGPAPRKEHSSGRRAWRRGWTCRRRAIRSARCAVFASLVRGRSLGSDALRHLQGDEAAADRGIAESYGAGRALRFARRINPPEKPGERRQSFLGGRRKCFPRRLRAGRGGARKHRLGAKAPCGSFGGDYAVGGRGRRGSAKSLARREPLWLSRREVFGRCWPRNSLKCSILHFVGVESVQSRLACSIMQITKGLALIVTDSAFRGA